MSCCCKNQHIFIFLSAFVIFFSFLVFILIMINSNSMQEKDILSTIAEEGDNSQIGDAIISFSRNDIQIGNAITHEPGSNSIIINETGIYQISYQLYGINNVCNLVHLANGDTSSKFGLLPIDNVVKFGIFDKGVISIISL